MFGQRVLGHMTPKMFAEYKVQRRLEGAAPATVNKELQLVRHAFNLAVREWEWCRTNPMHRVALEQVRNEVDRWLTVEEEMHLMAISSPWLHGIIVFALNTGMRQGEILNLHWEHVDFKTGIMTQRYAHHSPESLRAGLSVLEKPFRIGTNLTQATRMREATRD